MSAKATKASLIAKELRRWGFQAVVKEPYVLVNGVPGLGHRILCPSCCWQGRRLPDCKNCTNYGER